MKNAIYILLCIATAAVGAWQMYMYINSVKDRSNPTGDLTTLVISIVCIIAALVFGGLFLAGRVNQEEELHITK